MAEPVALETPAEVCRRWAAVDFRAMGSRCRIIAPDVDLAEQGRDLVQRLERSWTRFSTRSELNQVNAAAGKVCLISPELHTALSAAVRAHRLSGGVFDVRCLAAVQQAGYERSWEDQVDPLPPCSSTNPPLRPPVGELELFDAPLAVLVPGGECLDLGGIGKGLAVDLVVAALRTAGAEQVQVELGGDIRVDGRPWATQWMVEVEDPWTPGRVAAQLDLGEGVAVATSSTLRRRWQRGDVSTHHLIDLRTMTSATTDLVAVTAIASEAWRADVAAKCALIAGRDGAPTVLEAFGASGLLFAADGTIEEITA